MAKKRGAKRKLAVVKNEDEENIEEQETNTVKNGVASGSSKTTPAKKKKSVIAKTEATKTKAKPSNSKSEDEGEEDEADYEVEKIIDVNYKKNGKREFLIRWKNYSAKHDTWEPEDNLSCDELIEKFLLAQEQRDKQRKDLRERPKAVSRYSAPAGGRKSRRTAGTRKSYTENEEDSD